MKKEWEMAVDTLSLFRWQNSKRIRPKKKKKKWQYSMGCELPNGDL